MPLRRPAALLVVAAAFAASSAACGAERGPTSADAPSPPAEDAPLLPEPVFLRQVDRTRGTRDCFAVLRGPEFVGAAGGHGLEPQERVVGVDLGRTQFAYPVQLLNHHEIVEHEAEGLHLLACW